MPACRFSGIAALLIGLVSIGTAWSGDARAQEPAGAISVNTDGDTVVFVGLTQLHEPRNLFELPAGTYVINAEKVLFKPFSKTVKVPADRIIRMTPEFRLPTEKPEADRMPEWTSNGFPEHKLSGIGSATSINPILAEMGAIAVGLHDVAGVLEDSLKSRHTEYKSTDPEKAAEQRVVDASIDETKLKNLKTVILNQYDSSGEQAFVGLSVTSLDGLDESLDPNRFKEIADTKLVSPDSVTSVTTVGAGNVILFKNQEVNCSARLSATIFSVFKMLSLPGGVSVVGKFTSYEVWTGDPGSLESKSISQAALINVKSTHAMKSGSLDLNGKIMYYATNLFSRDSSGESNNQIIKSELKLSIMMDAKTVVVDMTDGVITGVSGSDVCGAVNSLDAILESSGYEVTTKDLPDSPYGAPLSRVKISRN